jgi:hypothetical protein
MPAAVDNSAFMIERVSAALVKAGLAPVAAIGFLAFRHGHLPEEPWYGRTLAQNLAWTGAALERIGL